MNYIQTLVLDWETTLIMMNDTSFRVDVEFFSGPKRPVRQGELGTLVRGPSVDAHWLSSLIDLIGGSRGGAPQ